MFAKELKGKNESRDLQSSRVDGVLVKTSLSTCESEFCVLEFGFGLRNFEMGLAFWVAVSFSKRCDNTLFFFTSKNYNNI